MSISRIIIIVVIVFTLAMAAWILFFGASDTRTETGKAATNTCPQYKLVSNPITGGTSVIDLCVDTDVAAVKTSKSGETAAISSATYGKCKTRWVRKITANRSGWDMFSIKMEKYWCYRNGKVTYAPKPVVTFWMASWASIAWDKKGVETQNDYYAGDKSWHRSYRTALWKKCVPTAFGCINIGERRMTTDIYAYGTGGWTS
jgi:hypothetical protein